MTYSDAKGEIEFFKSQGHWDERLKNECLSDFEERMSIEAINRINNAISANQWGVI